ncbi:hypothetical protein ABZ639_08685 [Saccharomonospora sp. NPDC006951]
MSSPSHPPILELRAAAKNRRVIVPLAALLTGAVLIVPPAVGGSLPVTVGAVVVWAAIFVPLAIYNHRLRVVLTHTEFGKVGLGKGRRHSRVNIAKAVRVTLLPPRAGSPPSANVFLLDPAGGLLLRLRDNEFDRAEFEDLIVRLGVPVTAYPAMLTAKQFSDQHPGTIRFWERRPYSFAALFGCGTMAILLIVAAVLSAYVLND